MTTNTIQVAISDASYAASLRDLLVRNGAREVVFVDQPDPGRGGVMVLDLDHLGFLSRPIQNPERVVLVAGKGSRDLNRAWAAGINSVITNKEPLNTAVLAIMAARLKAANSPQPGPAAETSWRKPPGGAPGAGGG